MHLAGTILRAGLRTSTVRPDWDVETYSEAGFVWEADKQKWTCLPNASQGKKGIFVVGAALYSESPTCELLSMSYDLKDGLGTRRWRPGLPLPADLIAHIRNGGELEAHNAPFEAWIAYNVLVTKYGFPPMKPEQFYCSMAKCRAWALPPSLADAGDVLNISAKKDKDGKRLLDKFSVPRNPTKADPRLRIRLEDDPVDAELLFKYNDRDIEAEAEISARVPDLSPIERQYWLVDFAINRRGIHVDRAGVENCIAIIEQAHERYNAELARITGGIVQKASEVQKTVGFLGGLKLYTESLDDEAVTGWLKRINDAEKARAEFEAECVRAGDPDPAHVDDPGLRFENVYAITNLPLAKRILEIRAEVGSASVKKVFSMRNRLSRADRIHDLFVFHGARTGRPTGDGPQSTNLPNSGPEVCKCDSCHRWFPKAIGWCVACGGQPAYRCAAKDGCKGFLPRGQMVCCGMPHGPKPFETEWHADAAECALEAIATRDLNYVEACWGNAMAAVSGVLRGLFNAAPGHDLICSDYSAIEAVVNAAISGVEWRMEVFRGKGKIYETSAAKTFKVPVSEILEYPDKHAGQKHPLRQKGKVTELALGYLGWIGALRNMGFEGTDDEAKDLILAWRDASPEIVFHGGGQSVPRGKLGKHPIFGGRRDGERFLYGLEGMAIAAIQSPGQLFKVIRLDGHHSGLSFVCHDDVLYMIGPDGTNIPYHRPRLQQSDKAWRGLSISFEGWNTNPKNGPYGWIRMFTYAGKLQENACQFLANRILRHGQVLLEAMAYPIVQHVYDENCSEVPEGFGSVEQYEAIMNIMPPWAKTPDGKPWPIRANGGWRGKRYRK